MKRYTGQQALYEAISRSRAKAKQGSILERLRPEPPKPEDPAQPLRTPTEPEKAPEQVSETARPEPIGPHVVETPPQPVVEQEPQVVPVEMPPETLSETSPEHIDQFEPAVWSRPVERIAPPSPPSPVRTWLRPRPVQLNEGRIEVSVPYYIGIIAGLAVMMVVLAAFRLGQARSGGQANAAARQVQPVVDRPGAPVNPQAASAPQNAMTTETSRPQANPTAPNEARQATPVAAVQGDHWLVLAQYKQEKDFEPVVQHFAGHGIKLGVVAIPALREYLAKNGINAGGLSGDGFLLVTAEAFENPNVAGTDGYKMKQRIAEVGALYKGKAPSGYESFAPNYFRDAYPKKIR